MCVYWTLILVIASALSSASSWDRYPNDFHGGYKPIRYGYRGTFTYHAPHVNYRVIHGPYYYKPPHHEFHIPHRGHCNWPGLGGPWGNKGSEGIEKPSILSTTIKDTFTTPSNILSSSGIPDAVCLRKCQDDQNFMNFNPVCGSNGVTYKNPSSLDCAKQCGIEVTLIKAGRCEEKDMEPTASPTFIINNVLPTVSYMDTIRNCLANCPSNHSENNPVCGNNGVTYQNPLQFECAKICGINVISMKPGRCIKDNGPPTTSIIVPTVPSMTSSNATIRFCLSKCPSLSIYKPVCGSDGITYKNFNQLLCANNCGVNVTIVSTSRCPTDDGTTVTTSSPTTVVPSSTPSILVIRTCMLNCPTTSEYNPICGSNGVTYDNPSRFECAKMCGLDIQMIRRSRCEVVGPSTNPTSGTTPTSISTLGPITNATPTPTTPNVTPKIPIVSPTTPNVTPTTPNGLDFTIPQDILDTIFTTDYGGLIDERYEENV